MSLIANLDLMLGVDSSAFNSKVKEASALLKETFGLDSKSANSLARLEDKLRKQAETFGMSSAEIEVYKLKMAGVPPAALKTAVALEAVVKALHDQKKAQDELTAKAKGVFDATRTSAERYEAKVAELRHMLKAGAIDQTTFNRALEDIPKPPSAWAKFGLKGVDGAAIARGFAVAGAAAAGAALGLGAFALAQIKLADDQGDLAGRLGVDVADLTRLQHAFTLTGSEAGDVGPAMQKLNANLSDAARNAAGPAATAFRRLGLSARDMLGKSPSANILAISDAFVGVTNPADRAGIAMDLFGKAGVNIVSSLAAGGGKLRELSDEADRLGITVSAADARMAGDAQDSVDRIWGAFGGLGKKIGAGLAPYILDVSTKFLEWVKVVDTTSAINTAIDAIGTGLAYVGDAVNLVKAGWQAETAAITKYLAFTVGNVALLGKAIDAITSKIPGMGTSFGTTLDAISGDLNKLAGEKWEDAKKTFATPPGNGIHQWFDGVKTKAADAAKAINGSTASTKGLDLAAADLAEKLRAQTEENAKAIATFGMSEAQKKAYDLKKLGATDDQLAPLKAQEAQLKGLELQKKAMDDLKEKAKGYLEASLTPLQKFKKERDEITASFAKGYIKTEAEKNQAIKHAYNDTVGKGGVKHAGALEAGSKEARSVILANMNGGKGNDWKTKLANVNQQILDESRKQTAAILAGNAGKKPPETVTIN